MNNRYGAVYEVVGYSALPVAEKEQLDTAMVRRFVKYGAAVGGKILEGGSLGVHVDRNSEYPDLYLELAPDGRLLLCDMDVRKAALLRRFRIFLKAFPSLSVVKRLDRAQGSDIQVV